MRLALSLVPVLALFACEPRGEPADPATTAVEASRGGESPTGGQPASKAGHEGSAPRSFDSPPPAGTRAHCPVMGHDFVVTEDSPRSEHEGRHYVFCCEACKPRFDANPAQFTS